MKLRLSAIVPIVASVAALSLAIVLLASGTSTSTANDKFWLSIDASNVGRNLVTLEPASTSTPPSIFPNPTPSRPNPLQPLSDFFTGFLNTTNLTGTINSGLQDLQSQALTALVQALNIRTRYRLYLTQACGLSLPPANSPAGTPLTVAECSSYTDKRQGLLNVTNAIPDTLPLGPLGQARIPLVTVLKRALETITGLAASGATAMFALLIIGATSEGLGVLLAVRGVFVLSPIRPGRGRGSEKVVPVTRGDGVVTAGVGRGDEYDAVGISGRSRFMLRVTLLFSLLGAAALVLAAVVATAIVLVAEAAGSLGGAVGLRIERSPSFVGIVWAAAGLAVVGAAYWVAVWFVEYRRAALVRTARTEMQVGNWKGIFREVLNNLKVKKA